MNTNKLAIPAETPLGLMVEAYNTGERLLGKDDRVQKFRDRNTAESRLQRQQEELEQMHGHARLEIDIDSKQIRWNLHAPERAVDEAVPHSTLPLEDRLRVLVDGNPKRPNTRSYKTFELYRDPRVTTGLTYVEVCIEHGYTRRLALSTLHYDRNKKYIELGASIETATDADASEDMTSKNLAAEDTANVEAGD